MAVLGKLGEKLKKARESKGYSVREVSENTHIVPKFVEALEKEDYSVFPSETYIVGFLRTYAEFLGLNPDEIIREYKGLKVQITESPVEELMKITKPKLDIDYQLIYKIVGIAFIVIIIGSGIYYLSKFISDKKITKPSEVVSCQEREIKKINIQENQPFLSLLDISQNYELTIPEIGNVNLCISELQITSEPKSLKLEVFFQNKGYFLQANSNETIILSNVIPELTKNIIQIEISVKEIMEDSTQIEIVAKKEISDRKNITVVLEIIQDTYLEWIADGKFYRGILLSQGDMRILEADTRLEIKIGNGAGVRYRLGDLPAKIAGPPGKIVKLSYSKVPDPLDPTKFRLVENIEVSQ